MNFSILFQILKKLDQGEYYIEQGCQVLKDKLAGIYFQLFYMTSALQSNANGIRVKECWLGFHSRCITATRHSMWWWCFVLFRCISSADKILDQVDHLPVSFSLGTWPGSVLMALASWSLYFCEKLTSLVLSFSAQWSLRKDICISRSHFPATGLNILSWSVAPMSSSITVTKTRWSVASLTCPQRRWNTVRTSRPWWRSVLPSLAFHCHAEPSLLSSELRRVVWNLSFVFGVSEPSVWRAVCPLNMAGGPHCPVSIVTFSSSCVSFRHRTPLPYAQSTVGSFCRLSMTKTWTTGYMPLTHSLLAQYGKKLFPCLLPLLGFWFQGRQHKQKRKSCCKQV